MKATLAFVACLLTAGFLTAAAEVVGNNTAVVIRKDVVKSDTGYQFLCVPVNGLDIANGKTTKVKLGTLLPAETLPAGTQLSLVGGNNSGATYYTDGNSWLDGAADIQLDGGQIFWLRYSNNARNTSADTVIFCGQDRARDVLTSLDSGVTALKNDSSQEITLNQAVNMQGFTLRTDDQILTIKAGSAEYKIYTYDVVGQNDDGTPRYGWYGEGFGSAAITDGANARIAPGEAFYYFRATAN